MLEVERSRVWLVTVPFIFAYCRAQSGDRQNDRLAEVLGRCMIVSSQRRKHSETRGEVRVTSHSGPGRSSHCHAHQARAWVVRSQSCLSWPRHVASWSCIVVTPYDLHCQLQISTKDWPAHQSISGRVDKRREELDACSSYISLGR